MQMNHRVGQLVLYLSDCLTREGRFSPAALHHELYYLDFHSFATRGNSVTGATYVRASTGPRLRGLDELLAELVRSGQMRQVRRGWLLRRTLMPNARPDLSLFSNNEKALVEKIARAFARRSPASFPSEYTMAWQVTPVGESISFELAFLALPSLSREDYEVGKDVFEDLLAAADDTASLPGAAHAF